MSNNLIRISILLVLLLLIGTLHAQEPDVNCVVVQNRDWTGCDPNYQPQQPTQLLRPQSQPVRWADQWGAIATDNQLGKVGVSVNEPGKSSAELKALNNCQNKGGTQCKILISYYNQCGAMIVGDGKINANSAATIKQASEAGLKICSAGATNCHVYYSACSLPRPTQ